VVEVLESCHARGFLWKVLGNCNDAKRRVNECMIAVRAERQRQNRIQARESRDKFQQSLKDLGFRPADPIASAAAAAATRQGVDKSRGPED